MRTGLLGDEAGGAIDSVEVVESEKRKETDESRHR